MQMFYEEIMLVIEDPTKCARSLRAHQRSHTPSPSPQDFSRRNHLASAFMVSCREEALRERR